VYGAFFVARAEGFLALCFGADFAARLGSISA
jgi:hypothetical protein